MNEQRTSLKSESKIKSFRVSDFTFRDLPWGVLAFLVLAIFAVGLGSLMEIFPTSIRWGCLGFAGGLYFGFVAGSRCGRSAGQTDSLQRPSTSNK
jgi:hypothetical protein